MGKHTPLKPKNKTFRTTAYLNLLTRTTSNHIIHKCISHVQLNIQKTKTKNTHSHSKYLYYLMPHEIRIQCTSITPQHQTIIDTHIP